MDIEKTPMKAIKMKCLECANWSRSEVTNCNLCDCALWPYRKGKRPTDEDIAIVAATEDPFDEQKRKYGIGKYTRIKGNTQNLSISRTNNREALCETTSPYISSSGDKEAVLGV